MSKTVSLLISRHGNQFIVRSKSYMNQPFYFYATRYFDTFKEASESYKRNHLHKPIPVTTPGLEISNPSLATNGELI